MDVFFGGDLEHKYNYNLFKSNKVYFLEVLKLYILDNRLEYIKNKKFCILYNLKFILIFNKH